MPRRQTFLTAVWSEEWKASYHALSPDRQTACDEAAISLIKQSSSPGLRIKPIHPEKYYLEGRINSGDRIVFRVEEAPPAQGEEEAAINLIKQSSSSGR